MHVHFCHVLCVKEVLALDGVCSFHHMGPRDRIYMVSIVASALVVHIFNWTSSPFHCDTFIF